MTWGYKAAVWGGFLGVVLLLHDFLPLLFLTFLLSFFCHTIMERLAARARLHRRVLLVGLYAALVAGGVSLGRWVVPQLLREVHAVAGAYAMRLEAERARAQADTSAARPDTGPARGVRRLVDEGAARLLGREAAQAFREAAVYEFIVSRATAEAEAAVAALTVRLFRAMPSLFHLALQAVLSVLFSFLILWDLDRIRESVRQIERGRFGHVWAEIAPGVADFGRVVGKAFQAQAVIAVVNTVLTGAGLVLLGIPKAVLLLTVVFFCSFVPIVGFIVSTVPIALLALQVGGLSLCLAAIAFVLAVHAVEAYLLNPHIYGHMLELHPVAVIFILLVGEHLAGVWGLLLGVPVASYVFEYVIQGKTGWPPRFPEESPGR